MKYSNTILVRMVFSVIALYLFGATKVQAQTFDIFSMLSKYTTPSSSQTIMQDVVIGIVIGGVNTPQGAAMLDTYQALFTKNIKASVSAKKITAMQGDALIAKIAELRIFAIDVSKKTQAERKIAIASKKADITAWATAQKIPEDASIFASSVELSMMMRDFAAIAGGQLSATMQTASSTNTAIATTASTTVYTTLYTTKPAQNGTGVATEAISITVPATLTTSNSTSALVAPKKVVAKKVIPKKKVVKKTIKKVVKKAPVKNTVVKKVPASTVQPVVKILPDVNNQY